MHQRQAVDQDGHVIAVVMAGALGLADLVLVDNLQAVFVDVLLVDQGDVLELPLSRRRTWTKSSWILRVFSTICSLGLAMAWAKN